MTIDPIDAETLDRLLDGIYRLDKDGGLAKARMDGLKKMEDRERMLVFDASKMDEAVEWARPYIEAVKRNPTYPWPKANKRDPVCDGQYHTFEISYMCPMFCLAVYVHVGNDVFRAAGRMEKRFTLESII